MSVVVPATFAPPSTRRLTRTYLACLWLIGALVLAIGLFVWYSANDMVGDAVRINQTGRQRTRTEHIAARGLGLMLGTPDATAKFDRAIAEWEHGWLLLTTGDASRHLAAPADIERRDIERLAPQIAALRAATLRAAAMRAANNAPSAPRADSLARASAELDARADGLIVALDELVQTLSIRQQRDLTRLRALEVTFTVLLLLLLAALGRYAMRPAIRAVGAMVRSQAAAASTLKQQTDALEQTSHALETQNSTLNVQQARLIDSQSELLTKSEALLEQRQLLEDHARILSRFAMTLDAMPDLVLMVGLDGTLLYQNPAATAALPEVEQHRGLSLLRVLSKTSARTMRENVLPQVMRDGVWQGELSLRSPEGQPYPMHCSVMAQRDRFNYTEVFVVVAHDLRGERLLQRSLAERELLHRAVIDSLAEGVIVQDREGHIVAWNESATRILGLSGDALSGRLSADPRWQATHIDGSPLEGDAHPISMARLRGERVDDFLMRITTTDGVTRELSVNARPMYTEDFEDRPGAVATFTDVTAERALLREMETLSVVVRQSNYAVLVTDATTRIVWVNDAFEQLTGYNKEEVVGQRPGSLLQGVHTSADTVARVRLALQQESAFLGELLNYRKDGTPYWVELSIAPLHDARGALTGFVGLSRDVTARRAADRERQTLAAALAVAADGVAIVDAAGGLEFVNHAFARQTGERAGRLIGRPWLSLYEAADAQQLATAVRTDVTTLGFWHGELNGRRAAGDTFPQELSLTLLPQGGLVAVVRDISERRVAEDRLRFLSTRDELTGLLNRRGFMHTAADVINEAYAQGQSCALLYGDLDRFKAINDVYGHSAGDMALKDVAAMLTGTFRSTDLIARLGGDEFTVLMCDIDRHEIDGVVARLHDAVAAHNAARADDPSQAWVIGMSLGMAFAERGERVDIDGLLRQADVAQYATKTSRRSRARAA